MMIKQGTFISDICGLVKTQKNGCLQASVIHTIYRYIPMQYHEEVVHSLTSTLYGCIGTSISI